LCQEKKERIFFIGEVFFLLTDPLMGDRYLAIGYFFAQFGRKVRNKGVNLGIDIKYEGRMGHQHIHNLSIIHRNFFTGRLCTHFAY
jgi:hypothetical protein